ncbi:hypothetical protein Vau01_115590 [Virgisporangium aurantiacum]|uniref:Uncharacterized protein n=1 Tax=Virgisporangium aurantiacum TaxID=175570 RepID=A0A8J3ZM30_9ACTN|nr:hypothetical protein Vau01_115590 [Virgisporangium aurantiacum]
MVGFAGGGAATIIKVQADPTIGGDAKVGGTIMAVTFLANGLVVTIIGIVQLARRRTRSASKTEPRRIGTSARPHQPQDHRWIEATSPIADVGEPQPCPILRAVRVGTSGVRGEHGEVTNGIPALFIRRRSAGRVAARPERRRAESWPPDTGEGGKDSGCLLRADIDDGLPG